jgi:hypothetical protein
MTRALNFGDFCRESPIGTRRRARLRVRLGDRDFGMKKL